jgi:hypothetical protein
LAIFIFRNPIIFMCEVNVVGLVINAAYGLSRNGLPV